MVKGDCVPLLARMIWTENKQLIGKVDDVFGPKHAPGIAVNPDTATGVKAESFKKGDKVSKKDVDIAMLAIYANTLICLQ